MEDTYNELWITGAYENFTQARDEGNVALAKDIIADTFDAGFDKEARLMAQELRAINV